MPPKTQRVGAHCPAKFQESENRMRQGNKPSAHYDIQSIILSFDLLFTNKSAIVRIKHFLLNDKHSKLKVFHLFQSYSFSTH